jgi:hypothetical protein
MLKKGKSDEKKHTQLMCVLNKARRRPIFSTILGAIE